MSDQNMCVRIRKSLGLTQDQFADKVKVSVKTIRNWEATEDVRPMVKVLLAQFDQPEVM
jgi:DNA-binding transcriptional regulator YiaG